MRNLADRNASGGGSDLRLAVAQGAHNGGSDYLSADHLAIARLVGATAGENDNLDWGALGGPVAVIQVVEVTRLALVPNSRATKGERAIVARAKACGVDGTGLRGFVELELKVTGNIASTVKSVSQDGVGKGGDKDAVARALSTLLLDKRLVSAADESAKEMKWLYYWGLGLGIVVFGLQTVAKTLSLGGGSRLVAAKQHEMLARDLKAKASRWQSTLCQSQIAGEALGDGRKGRGQRGCDDLRQWGHHASEHPQP